MATVGCLVLGGCAAATKYEGYPIVMPLEKNVDMCTNVHSSTEFDPDKVKLVVGISSDLKFNFDSGDIREFEKCVWVKLFSRQNLLTGIEGDLTVRIREVWFEDDDLDKVVHPYKTSENSYLTYGYEVVGWVNVDFFQGMGDRRIFTLDYSALKRMVKGYVKPQYELEEFSGSEYDQKTQMNRDLALTTALVHALQELRMDFIANKASAPKAPRMTKRGKP